jgi:hypothetical protein
LPAIKQARRRFTPSLASYQLRINSSAAARARAAEAGYNFVFAKGVDGGYGGPAYNTAWDALRPDEVGDSVIVSWDVDYQASYSNDTAVDGATIRLAGNVVELQQGGYYQVDSSGTLGPDPNKPVDPSRNAFHFLNSLGYPTEYAPVLLSPSPTGHVVPIWIAGTGMASDNGRLGAAPAAS